MKINRQSSHQKLLSTWNSIYIFTHIICIYSQDLVSSYHIHKLGDAFLHLNKILSLINFKQNNNNNLQFALFALYSTTFMKSQEQQEILDLSQPKKKIKIDQHLENEDDRWIIVKKKDNTIDISIADAQKILRYYSHISLQKYLRFLITKSAPNPMWLSIKRQSLIQHFIYIDFEIENTLFEYMLENKQLAYLASKINKNNKAIFKASKIGRNQLWEYMLSYDNDDLIQQVSNGLNQISKQLNNQLYSKYITYVLSQQQLKNCEYPIKQCEQYNNYFQIQQQKLNNNKVQLKNHILIIDCEMVLSINGFQLARATIMNFQGEVIFDQLFKPEIQIINYNTQYSGMTKQMLDPVTNTLINKLYPFLIHILCDKTILVGHSLQNDLRTMKFIHTQIIDTSILYMRTNGTKHKLKMLADRILKRKIQIGEHDSVEDCQATLDLLKLKVQLQKGIKKKQYQMLKEMTAAKKKAVVIDYAIDYDMKQYNAHHFEKIVQREQLEQIFKVLKKYLRKDIAIPDLVMTRVQKPNKSDWQDYYRTFDEQFKQFYISLPVFSIIILNCQINPSIQIVIPTKSLKPQSESRPFCIFLTK